METSPSVTINMASARKKLDEKNLKTLRELLSQPGNKHCFDCHQRGPTYVNVTIGSFVCTTCSGMLRGLTPPHRVKSITMATFNQEEIDFISVRGNEFCKKIWLGLGDGHNTSVIGHTNGGKDEQALKDYMVSVYERKRYYVNPSDADKVNSSARETKHHQLQYKLPTPNGHSGSFHQASALSNNNNQHYNNNFRNSRNNNSVPVVSPPKGTAYNADPFGSLGFNSQEIPSSQPADNFANFDNNPVFTNSISEQGKMSFDKLPQPPSEDRYAALKDLDSLMKSQLSTTDVPQPATAQPADWGQSNWTPSFDDASRLPESNVFDKPSNPFSSNTENGWGSVTSPFGANPFKTEITWPTHNGGVPNGLPVSQSLNFNQTKSPWDIDQTPNPFLVNGSSQPPIHHSSNPFL